MSLTRSVTSDSRSTVHRWIDDFESDCWTYGSTMSDNSYASGLGSVSGRVIMAAGEYILEIVDVIIIKRRLRIIEGIIMAKTAGSFSLNREVFLHILELQRHLYSQDIRRRAWNSILHILDSKSQSNWISPMVQVMRSMWTDRPFEHTLFVRQLVLCALCQWNIHPIELNSESVSSMLVGSEMPRSQGGKARPVPYNFNLFLVEILENAPEVAQDVLGFKIFSFLHTNSPSQHLFDIQNEAHLIGFLERLIQCNYEGLCSRAFASSSLYDDLVDALAPIFDIIDSSICYIRDSPSPMDVSFGRAINEWVLSRIRGSTHWHSSREEQKLAVFIIAEFIPILYFNTSIASYLPTDSSTHIGFLEMIQMVQRFLSGYSDPFSPELTTALNYVVLNIVFSFLASNSSWLLEIMGGFGTEECETLRSSFSDMLYLLHHVTEGGNLTPVLSNNLSPFLRSYRSAEHSIKLKCLFEHMWICHHYLGYNSGYGREHHNFENLNACNHSVLATLYTPQARSEAYPPRVQH
ncbi:hypothetical protein C8Q75DRAFT_895793 [Abortiporus biennis]|nr:hypothetical protein C8Q75DRAFT_895793 [Abortiporus biennis]